MTSGVDTDYRYSLNITALWSLYLRTSCGQSDIRVFGDYMYFSNAFRSVTPPVRDGETRCPIDRMEEVVGFSDLLLYEYDPIGTPERQSARCMSRFLGIPAVLVSNSCITAYTEGRRFCMGSCSFPNLSVCAPI